MVQHTLKFPYIEIQKVNVDLTMLLLLNRNIEIYHNVWLYVTGDLYKYL
jgi:hypothetical protein